MGYLTVGTWLGNAMGYGLSYCGYVVRESDITELQVTCPTLFAYSSVYYVSMLFPNGQALTESPLLKGEATEDNLRQRAEPI